MKKYLLLASTALLFNTNAWAEPVYPAGGQNTREIGVAATIVMGGALYPMVGQMDFKRIVVGDVTSDISLTMNAATGVITNNSSAGVIYEFDNEGEPASVSCIGTLPTGVHFECVGSGTPSTGCAIGSTGLSIINPTHNLDDVIAASGTELLHFGGTLTGTVSSDMTIDEDAIIRVVAEY